jgi:hypothetical protein
MPGRMSGVAGTPIDANLRGLVGPDESCAALSPPRVGGLWGTRGREPR